MEGSIVKTMLSASSLRAAIGRLKSPTAAHSIHHSFTFPPVTQLLPEVHNAMQELISERGNRSVFPAMSSRDTLEFEWGTIQALSEMLSLPDRFSFRAQGTFVALPSDEYALVLMLAAARRDAARRLQDRKLRKLGLSGVDSRTLVVYCHPQQLLKVRRVASVAGLGVVRPFEAHYDQARQNYFVSAEELDRRMEEDVARGLFPCAVIATLGTSVSAVSDPVLELSAICAKHGRVWLHVDAWYGWATGFVDPAFGTQVQCANSFSLDPSCWVGLSAPMGLIFFAERECLADAYGDGAIVRRPPECDDSVPLCVDPIRFDIGSRSHHGNLLLPLGLSLLAVPNDYWRRQVLDVADVLTHLTKSIQSDPRFQCISSSLGVVTFRFTRALNPSEFLKALASRGFGLSTGLDPNGNTIMVACVAGRSIDEVSRLAEELKSVYDSMTS